MGSSYHSPGPARQRNTDSRALGGLGCNKNISLVFIPSSPLFEPGVFLREILLNARGLDADSTFNGPKNRNGPTVEKSKNSGLHG